MSASTVTLRLCAVLAVMIMGLASHPASGAWTDSTTGLPLVENFSAKEFGPGESKWIVLQDKYGRLFVGGQGLQVFDGQSWRTFPAGAGYSLIALAFGRDDRIWAGAVNEVGYFDEESLGVFKYHSLVPRLPKELTPVGEVWGCAQVGRMVYFICRNKVLCWDGTSFKIQTFEGQSRLFPINLGEEFWFHHVATGLYRLGENGPQLEIPAADLPAAGILGLAKDKEGLLVASNSGLYRPGHPPRRISDDQLSRHIADNRLASFAPLPGGNYALGTVNGGLVIARQAGVPLRFLDTSDGLPSRFAYSFQTDPNGYLWCATPIGIMNLEGSGRISVYNALNGLKGKVRNIVRLPDARLIAFTGEGVYQLAENQTDGGRFQPSPQLTDTTYSQLLPVPGGMVLTRHGGVDFFDGSKLQTILRLTGSGAYLAAPARTDPKTFYLLENSGLSRMVQQPDGTFTNEFLIKPPDYIQALHEDTSGRLWLGTLGEGAFIYDPASKQLAPLRHPENGNPLSGPVSVIDTAQGILLLANGRALWARPDGTGLKTLSGTLAINPLVARPTPNAQDVLVAFQRIAPADSSTQGLGVLTVAASGQTRWRELDVPELGMTGFVNTMEFTEENGRPILWIGGSNGALRLDYDTLPPVQRPSTPYIRLNTGSAGLVSAADDFSFRFRGHQLNFHVFTGDYIRSKGCRLQVRLGGGAWSEPSARRSYEFSSLSEGDYRFEARTINPAGLASEPAVFAFRILPPWYRSGWAFAGYAVALGLGVVTVIRVRERQIRARNLQLEALVKIRTAELVKANAAKDEFLAGISHEIRNPMSGVIGIAGTFRTDGLDPESRHKFGLLRECATHLASLLEDILEFSKVQAGAIEIETKPFNLRELMGAIAAMTAADSEKRGLPVEIAVSPAVPAQLVGDARRIRQILLNFVSNALKFSNRGQVSVTVWCKPLNAASTEVIFAVSDDGPGIAPEEQQRLFTRFERGAAAQQGRVPGTGLGLALCKGLAEKMGGRIWLESEPGRGSCFSFSAPFAIAEPDTADEPGPTAPVPGQAKVALVVDDQEYNRIVLTDLLESLGFTVHTASDGTAALALAGSREFDAVFLDFNLPDLSGLEVTRGIRALTNKSAGAVILATTAFSTPEKRRQCLAAGMNAFLGKPVTMERLRKALSAAMPVGPAAAPAPAAAPPPADRLANLRLLAKKKGAPFADELALYLSEFEVEFDQLKLAVQQEDAIGAARCAHLLYGRCAFIGERELELALRRIEADCAIGRWEDVRTALTGLAGQVAGLRVRLASSDPVAPPA